jgi:hypothetical protein
MNTIIYKNFEFTYETSFIDQVNKTESVIVYSQITIIKGDDKFSVGEQIDQISILSSIHFENKDGSVYNNVNLDLTNNIDDFYDKDSSGINSNEAVEKIYSEFEQLNTDNRN